MFMNVETIVWNFHGTVEVLYLFVEIVAAK